MIDGVANWLLIVIGVVTLLFICLATYICVQMRRNKSERHLQERAIVREVYLAKAEGIEIPDDLSKRLERFQDGAEDMGGKMKDN